MEQGSMKGGVLPGFDRIRRTWDLVEQDLRFEHPSHCQAQFTKLRRKLEKSLLRTRDVALAGLGPALRPGWP